MGRRDDDVTPDELQADIYRDELTKNMKQAALFFAMGSTCISS